MSKRSLVPVENDAEDGRIGNVTVLSEDGTFLISVLGEDRPHERNFVTLDARYGKIYFRMIAQIELVFGEHIKTGEVETRKISGSFLGVGANFASLKEKMEAKFHAQARVIGFVDQNGKKYSQIDSKDYLMAPVYYAENNLLEAFFSKIRSEDIHPLEVGSLIGMRSERVVPVAFDPTGFMRHSIVFGQSGSGKSFSFGIILEELLLGTSARVIVFDPNSDYKNFSKVRKLGEVRKRSRRNYASRVHQAVNRHWSALSKDFLQYGISGGEKSTPIRLKFSDLTRREQALLLGFDLDRDPEEYAVFSDTVTSLGNSYSIEDVLEGLQDKPSQEKVRTIYRIRNRELDKAPLWSGGSFIEELHQKDWRFASIDLREEDAVDRSIIASASLRALYQEIIESRTVTFIVIDEAHNFCPRLPANEYQEQTSQIIQEIAAEGRKYGAFLMLQTQTPSKINEQVLSQCENVILMKMNSPGELQSLQPMIEGASSRLAQRVSVLGQGEALCMGQIVDGLTTMKFDLRKSAPGGEDVSKDWAKPS